MVELARALRGSGITCGWPGGRRHAIVEARAAGAALNVWDADPALVAARSQGPEAVEVTWGGPPPRGALVVEAMVRELAQAGATWAIFGWPIDPAALAAAARAGGAEARSSRRP